jgi:hypothetical protein
MSVSIFFKIHIMIVICLWTSIILYSPCYNYSVNAVNSVKLYCKYRYDKYYTHMVKYYSWPKFCLIDKVISGIEFNEIYMDIPLTHDMCLHTPNCKSIAADYVRMNTKYDLRVSKAENATCLYTIPDDAYVYIKDTERFRADKIEFLERIASHI